MPPLAKLIKSYVVAAKAVEFSCFFWLDNHNLCFVAFLHFFLSLFRQKTVKT